VPAARRLLRRHALREIDGRFAFVRHFDDVHAPRHRPQGQHVEGDADLFQQFAPPRRLGSQVNPFVYQHVRRVRCRSYCQSRW